MKYLLALILLSVSLYGCNQATPKTLVTAGYDQTEMDTAIARARREVDTFTAELAQPTGTGHAVKAPITDANGTEHFWLIDVKFHDGKFEGTIDNDPGVVQNVKAGQQWTLTKAEISDWMFMREGKMYGNYTMRPLLKTLPKKEADEFRAMFATP